MIRKSMAVLGAVIACAFATTACKNAADERRAAEENRIEAERKMAEAQRTQDLERRNDKLESAQKDMAEAQKDMSDADRKLMKEKAEYREKVQKKIADLDEDIRDLQADGAKATGKSKTDYDNAIRDVQTRRDALNTDLSRVDTVAANEWDGFKKTVDDHVDQLEKSVKTASSKIKATGRRIGEKTDRAVDDVRTTPRTTTPPARTVDPVR